MHPDSSPRPAGYTGGPPPRPVRGDDNALWLMSLADLMLVLIAFFVLLAVADPSMSQTATAPDAQGSTGTHPAEQPGRTVPVAPAVRKSSDQDALTPRAEPARPRQRQSPPDLIRTFMAARDDQPRTDRLAPSRRLAMYRPAAPPHDRGAPALGAVSGITVPPASTVAMDQPRPSTSPANPSLPPAPREEPVSVTPPPAPDPRQQATREAEATLRDIFRSAGDRVEISPGAGAVTVRLRDTITFDSASADLLPNVRPLLARVAQWLATHPGIALEVSGHTDDVPIATARYPSNWELSAARAAAVARQLLEGTAIDPRRAHIAGYGEHRPLDDAQEDRANRARNRRVEIRFLLPVNPTS